jgi:SAM-dependent methyltransferase
MNANNWNKMYGELRDCLFPGNRYPHEPLIHFISNIGRSSDNTDNYIREVLDLHRHYNKKLFDDQLTLERKALDIGFGTISDLIMLLDYGYKGYGVEVSDHAIECARRAAKHFDYPISVSHYKPYNLDFSDSYFDLVVSNASAYYNVDFEKFLKETYRVLKKDGYFFHRMIAKDHGYFENNYADYCYSNVYEWTRYPLDEINGLQFVCYDKQELYDVFNRDFKNVKVSYLKYDYQTLKQSWWIVTGKK